MLAVPFSVVGAVWLMYALGYNVSIAAWVGMIALMGLDAETGVFMHLFLDLSHEEARSKGLLRPRADLEEVFHGAVKRVRPKLMTVVAAFMGLMPIMLSVGSGADVMKRVAAPMVGGLAASLLLELLSTRRSTCSGSCGWSRSHQAESRGPARKSGFTPSAPSPCSRDEKLTSSRTPSWP